MHRALYRKWRPQTFGDVVGQKAITTALLNQITAEKIGHAYLFTGTRGTGKTSCAKIFAMAVNCEDPNGGEPCGVCEVCTGLLNGSILDVAEIDAASNNGVDDVRDLREETIYRPTRAKYRVYIIDEVHMLSTAAFNALLKTLEEPPQHVIFILATTEIHKVPATILSRCQRFDFMRIAPDDIAKRLLYISEKEDIDLKTDAADLLARLSDGAMRDALSLLDTCAGAGEAIDTHTVRRMAGICDKDYLFQLSSAAKNADTSQILTLVGELHTHSVDARRLCEEMVFHYRNLLLAKADAEGRLLDRVPTEEKAQYIEESAVYDEKELIRALQRLATAIDKMARSPEPRLELELALFDITEDKRAAQSAYSAQSVVTPPQVSAAPKIAQSQSKPVPPAQAAPFDVDEPVTSEQIAAPFDGGEPVAELVQAVNEVAEEKIQPIAEMPPLPVAEPITELEDGIQIFTQWPQVLEKMLGTDRLLSSYMAGSRGYTDGVRVLIDGGQMFLAYIRANKNASETIKTVIESVCGKRYGIGPYEGPTAENIKQKTAKDTLMEWEKKGVTVTTE